MTTPTTNSSGRSLLGTWNSLPLYGRIAVALLAGVVVGLLLGDWSAPLLKLGWKPETLEKLLDQRIVAIDLLGLCAKVILQLLGALAPPLILVAVIHTLMVTEMKGSTARRLAGLLLLNTTVAILIGLFVANTLRPGKTSAREQTRSSEKTEESTTKEAGESNIPQGTSLNTILLQLFPKSLFGPLTDNSNVIGVIFIGVAFGIALRRAPHEQVRGLIEVSFQSLIVVLHWVIQLVPLGVFAIVAKVIGTEGFDSLKKMLAFVVAVLVALLLQTIWYLLRIRLLSWCRPLDVLRGMRDALLMAFSTGSSTATMPVTFECLKTNVGIREESASMGALVGANFNNDGTALYEAMAALFVAQMLGMDLSLGQQLVVILTSIVASVGAAGIPEAGMVTMTLVFKSVGLPTESIALLLTVDWFLDRCRTTVNVLGDVNVSCLLDGKTKAVTNPVLATTIIPAS